MNRQDHEPPFHGEPCPMCPLEIRSVSSLLHNFLVRWPKDYKALAKICDLRLTKPSLMGSSHPYVQTMLNVAAKLLEAAADLEMDVQGTMRWTKQCWDQIYQVEPLVRATMVKVQDLSDAHFHDRRHASGQPNILHESQGGRSSLDGKYTDYNHWVRVVSVGPLIDTRAHLWHAPCLTALELHNSFTMQMAADPTFYEQIYCPGCKANVPASSFCHRST